jgi:hypothetical protein
METINEPQVEVEPPTRAYIREWKRQNYKKHPEEMKATQRAYYYKYKYGVDDDDMRKYKSLFVFASGVKTRKRARTVKNRQSSFFERNLSKIHGGGLGIL